MRQVLAAGLSRRQIEQALALSFAFNVITRLADAFGSFAGGPELFATGAKHLLAPGYAPGQERPSMETSRLTLLVGGNRRDLKPRRAPSSTRH